MDVAPEGLKITQGEADDLCELVKELEELEGPAGQEAARLSSFLKRVLKHAPPPDPFGFQVPTADEKITSDHRSMTKSAENQAHGAALPVPRLITPSENRLVQAIENYFRARTDAEHGGSDERRVYYAGRYDVVEREVDAAVMARAAEIVARWYSTTSDNNAVPFTFAEAAASELRGVAARRSITREAEDWSLQRDKRSIEIDALRTVILERDGQIERLRVELAQLAMECDEQLAGRKRALELLGKSLAQVVTLTERLYKQVPPGVSKREPDYPVDTQELTT